MTKPSREIGDCIVWEDGKLTAVLNVCCCPKTKESCAKNAPKDRNQPIEGLVIVQGLTQEGDSWTDGILWTHNGKSYDCTIKLDDENTLNARGFLGFSFGRTQVWKRKS